MASGGGGVETFPPKISGTSIPVRLTVRMTDWLTEWMTVRKKERKEKSLCPINKLQIVI